MLKVNGIQAVQSSSSSVNHGLLRFWTAVYFLKPNGQFQPYVHGIRQKFWLIKGVFFLPGFSWGMLTVWIGYFPFPNTFELSCYWPIAQLCLGQDGTGTLQILGVIGSFHRLIAPTDLWMPTQATCGLCITGVQEPTNIPAIFPSTMFCSTFKNMGPATFHVLDSRSFPEENIYWWVPVLWESFYYLQSSQV